MNPKSKLNWLSNRTIRDLKISKVLESLLPFLKDRKDIPEEVKNINSPALTSIIESIRVYLDNLAQAPDYIAEFFVTDLKIQSQEATGFMKDGDGPKVVKEFYGILKNSDPKTDENYKDLMSKVGEVTGQKGKTLYMPIRVATTGKSVGLELPILFPLLGKEKLLQRIEKTAKEAGIPLST